MVKVYSSYGGLFVFKLFDDYRVCVKKRNFYRPPSDATSGDAWRCEPAYVLAEDFSLVGTIFTSKEGEGPDRRRCRLVCRIRDRRCFTKMQKKNSSYLLQAFRRSSHYACALKGQ